MTCSRLSIAGTFPNRFPRGECQPSETFDIDMVDFEHD